MYLEAQIRTDDCTRYIPKEYRNKTIITKRLGIRYNRETVSIKIPDTYKIVSKGIINDKDSLREREQFTLHLGINKQNFVIEVEDIDIINKGDILVIDSDIQIIIINKLK